MDFLIEYAPLILLGVGIFLKVRGAKEKLEKSARNGQPQAMGEVFPQVETVDDDSVYPAGGLGPAPTFPTFNDILNRDKHRDKNYKEMPCVAPAAKKAAAEEKPMPRQPKPAADGSRPSLSTRSAAKRAFISSEIFNRKY